MSAFTGLSADFIKRADLRVDLGRFQNELLRDRRESIGRFDSRYTGIDTDAAATSPDDDPAGTAISGAFIATFNDYVTHDLGYNTDMPYRSPPTALPGFDWDWKHRRPAGDGGAQIAPNTGRRSRLHDADQPVSEGAVTERLLRHGDAVLRHRIRRRAPAARPPNCRRNIQFRYYQSGHMIYLNPAELAHMHDDLAAWYDATVGASEALAPARTGRSGRGHAR